MEAFRFGGLKPQSSSNAYSRPHPDPVALTRRFLWLLRHHDDDDAHHHLRKGDGDGRGFFVGDGAAGCVPLRAGDRARQTSLR